MAWRPSTPLSGQASGIPSWPSPIRAPLASDRDRRRLRRWQQVLRPGGSGPGPAGDYGGHPVSLIVRSGCYVTHDHGTYETAVPVSVVGRHRPPRARPRAVGRGPLRPGTGPRHRRARQIGTPRSTSAYLCRCTWPGALARKWKLSPTAPSWRSTTSTATSDRARARLGRRSRRPYARGPDRLRALAPLYRLRQVEDRPARGRRLRGPGTYPDLFSLTGRRDLGLGEPKFEALGVAVQAVERFHPPSLFGCERLQFAAKTLA